VPYVTRDPDSPCKTCATLPDEPLGCAPCDWQPCQWTCDGCDCGPEVVHDPALVADDKTYCHHCAWDLLRGLEVLRKAGVGVRPVKGGWARCIWIIGTWREAQSPGDFYRALLAQVRAESEKPPE